MALYQTDSLEGASYSKSGVDPVPFTKSALL